MASGNLLAMLLALAAFTAHAQECQGPVHDEYQTAGADVIIGVMQDFYDLDSDGVGCVGPTHYGEIYEAIKVAIGALPDGMTAPTFQIGLERYESCGSPERAIEDATYYVSQIVNAVNSSDHVSPCNDSPFRPGLLGPKSSYEAKSVSTLLATFNVPIVSHGADHPWLSDVGLYGSFVRTVPSATVQAEAMVDLLVHMGWTYVQLLHGEGFFADEADAFKEAAKGRVELASEVTYPKEMANYGDVVTELVAHSTEAKVVIFWGSSTDTIDLLTAIQSMGGEALNLQIVGSSSVGMASDTALTTSSVMTAAKGLMSLAPGQFSSTPFQDYLSANNLDAANNPYVEPAVDAAHVYVDSLRRAHTELCAAGTTGVCNAMKMLSPEEFLGYVRAADFTGVSGRRVAFDAHGDPVSAAYEIRQFKSDGGSYTWQKVGQWTDSSALSLDNNIDFYTQSGMSSTPPTSACASGSCPVIYDHYDVVTIAGLFPIYAPGCSVFSTHSGYEHSQAMLWAMDQVNKDSSILPGIQLNPLLGETCSSTDQASSATYDIIQKFARQPGSAFGSYHNDEDHTDEYIAGVISRVDDDATVEIDQVLQSAGVPQVSDSARLDSLSDKAEFPYFSRLISPTCSLLKAILEFLKAHELTYVQVVQSRNGIYNETAAAFLEKAKEHGICVAQTITFEPLTDYNGVVDRILAKPSADIVISFADYDESQIFFSALERRDLPGEFLQVIYAFIEDTHYFDSWNRQAHVDSITLARKSTPVEDFVDYFIAMTPDSAMTHDLFSDQVHNEWFYHYWMNRFQCQLSGTGLPQLFSSPCTGNEMLERDDVYSTEGVVNAVYVYAHALAQLQRDKCGADSFGLCSALLATGPLEWTRYIREVSFLSLSGSMAQVSFDEEGDAPGAINIKVLDGYLENRVIASYEESSGLEAVDLRFEIGSGKESTCRGSCYDCSPPEELGASYIRIPGDFDVTAVLWLSEEGTGANLTCGATRYQETMAIEVIKFALEEINNSSLLLPDIKLGLTIVDSCGQFLVTARQLTALMGRTATNLPPTGPMLGVLGPVREYLQGHVASDVTSPFWIPTIGFTPASPSVFSDEGPYPASSLLSTAPSYTFEAVAVVDVLKHKGWNHVVFVYSHSYYGHAGNQSFNEEAQAKGVCVKDSIGIDLDSPQDIHDQIVQTIRDYGITVVVAFVESTDARRLLTAERTLGDTGAKITWVGSDKWFTDPEVDVTAGLEDIARGAIVVTNYMVDLNPLKEHLSKLDLMKETTENHWLRNYVQEKLTDGCGTEQCIQDVDLGTQAALPAYTATLINAVHVMAQAVHNKIQIACGNTAFAGHVYKRSNYHNRPNVTVPLCPEFYEATWHDLLYAVRDVYVFEGAGGRPFWFEDRQGPAEYTIINFQGEVSSARFVPVGEWVSGELTMNDAAMYLYNPAADQPIDAPAGCPADLSVCDQTSEAPSQWTWGTGAEAWSIIVLIVTAIGGFLCVAAVIVFVGRRQSAVIQTASPFLMCMLALGVILMYLNNVWYMVSPMASVCGVRRWMTGFSYAVVYAALVTKALRASVLSRHTTTKSMVGTSMAQGVLFCVILGAEIILVSEWLILDAPDVVAVHEMMSGAGCEVVASYACSHANTSIVVSMIYVYILVLATFVLSFFASAAAARDANNRSDNKFRLLASFLSICILVAWGCCYTLLPQESFQTPAILIGITVDATSILLFTIVPKMVAFYHGNDDQEQDDSTLESYGPEEKYREKGDFDAPEQKRIEKDGYDNKGAVINTSDDQTPF